MRKERSPSCRVSSQRQSHRVGVEGECRCSAALTAGPVSATVSEHTMLLEGTASRPPPGGPGPVTGAEIMRKLSKTHTHSDSALKIKVWFCCF